MIEAICACELHKTFCSCCFKLKGASDNKIEDFKDLLYYSPCPCVKTYGGNRRHSDVLDMPGDSPRNHPTVRCPVFPTGERPFDL